MGGRRKCMWRKGILRDACTIHPEKFQEVLSVGQSSLEQGMALQAGHSKRNHTKKGRRRLPHAKRDDDKDHEEEGTGVNKIKSAIRQTKRILARVRIADDLKLCTLTDSILQDSTSASARQEAERKLVALEDELESRQSSVRERKNAVRYHKVRFFGRWAIVKEEVSHSLPMY